MERDGLAGVEIRHLRALVAIAETCSFARAGERLGYAQSAVSQQIGALERAVGMQLVERPGGPRPVSLTEPGSILVEHARAILNRLGAAQDDLEALAAGEAGTIRVGTFQSAGARLLPAILQAFHESHPRITVELTGATSDADLLGMVLSGDLDVAFAIDVSGDERFDGEVLTEDQYFVIVPPNSPHASKTALHLSQLGGESFVGWSCCPNGVIVEEQLKRFGADLNVVFRTDDNLTMQRLVGAGFGIAVMPELCIEREASGEAGVAQILDIADDMPPRRIGVYWRSARRPTPALRAFVETCRVVGTRLPLELVA
jgi:DNA-binding transcriptional LysR family regulator